MTEEEKTYIYICRQKYVNVLFGSQYCTPAPRHHHTCPSVSVYIVIITVHTSHFNECVAAAAEKKSQEKSYNLLAALTSIN